MGEQGLGSDEDERKGSKGGEGGWLRDENDMVDAGEDVPQLTAWGLDANGRQRTGSVPRRSAPTVTHRRSFSTSGRCASTIPASSSCSRILHDSHRHHEHLQPAPHRI